MRVRCGKGEDGGDCAELGVRRLRMHLRPGFAKKGDGDITVSGGGERQVMQSKEVVCPVDDSQRRI